MKVIFAGTPEFARVALQQLLTAGFEVPLVLTQPDRPAGRGMKLQASPVKQLALQHQTAVVQPRSLRLDGKFPEDAAQARDAILAAGADAILVCVVSSEGEAFKNNEVSTTLDVTIFHGAKSVTTKEQLVAEFSSAYYLRWWYRARGATGYSELSSTDPRLSNDGFTQSVSPKDVDQQTIFRCTLDDGK